MEKSLRVGLSLMAIGVILAALPLVTFEPYEAQKSSVLLDETFPVSIQVIYREANLTNGTLVKYPTIRSSIVNHAVYFNKGDLVNIQVTVMGSGDSSPAVLFVVTDGAVEYIKQEGEDFVYNENWTTPISANYTFRYVKTGFNRPTKTVTELVTKLWTDTAYRLRFPIEALYVGIALFIAGEGIIVYAAVKREAHATARSP